MTGADVTFGRVDHPNVTSAPSWTALLPWFDANVRDLPWRRPGTTPWGVLVSEVMLQQTPVARVTPVWWEWLLRWPTPPTLAAASQADLLRTWGKLGYPRRALRLHAAAAAITVAHRGLVPSDVDTLLALPGVGAYTARAVAAFAYRRRVPVVDTNVRRVLDRAVRGTAESGGAPGSADLRDVARLLPEDGPTAARFSAALMELGALVCTARNPDCAQCPLRTGCRWLRAGRPARAGPPRPVQRFDGTDRQVRGRLLDVLRDSPAPVARAALDATWSEAAQRDRCLASLLADGLVEQTAAGQFALPGEAGSRRISTGRSAERGETGLVAGRSGRAPNRRGWRQS